MNSMDPETLDRRKSISILVIGRSFRWLTLLILGFSLAACAITGPRLVDHSFEFNAVWDSPEIEILDYRYGDSKAPGARPPEWALESGKVAQGTGTSGPMILGDSLYVKWRVRSTGETYQDTVDLRSRLPANMKDKKIRLIVKGAQLYIFVISPEIIVPNPCPPKEELRQLSRSSEAGDRVFSMYCNHKIVTIYPDQSKD